MPYTHHGATIFLLVVLALFVSAQPARSHSTQEAVFEAPLLQGGNPHLRRGTIQATLDGSELRLFAAFWNLTYPLSQIDVYRGDPNEGGVSVKNLGIMAPNQYAMGGGIDATLALTNDQVQELNDGRLYFVVHTMNTDPANRLTARIQPPAAAAEFMEAPLTQLWQSVAVARGRVRALATPNGLRLICFFNGLASNWQQIVLHRGALGSGGEQVATLFNYSPTSGLFDGVDYTFQLEDGWEEDLRAGLLSVEVRTTRQADRVSGRLRHPSNQAPAASALTSPANGEYIVIGGTTEPVDPDVYLGQVEFTRVEDPDADPVAYLWQASLHPDFQVRTVTIDLGVDETRTHLTVEFAAALFDSLTAGMAGGVPLLLNTPTTVYHRVVTTDGAMYTVGPARHVTFVRGQITSVDSQDETPGGFALHGNYPNPFNPSTTVVFDLPAPALVTLELFDLMGRRVLATPEAALAAGGRQRIDVDGSSLASGTYVYRITARMAAGATSGTGRMMLVK